MSDFDVEDLYLDLAELLGGNAGTGHTNPRQVQREEFARREDGDVDVGFITWTMEVDTVNDCSEGYSGIVEGPFDVIVWGRKRDTRKKAKKDVLDIFLPIDSGSGRRQSLGPKQLTNTFLSFCYLDDINEVFTEKTGHPNAELPGLQLSFRLKAKV